METFATSPSAGEPPSFRRLIIGKHRLSEKVTARKGDTATDGQLSYWSLREGWEVDSFSKDSARFWH